MWRVKSCSQRGAVRRLTLIAAIMLCACSESESVEPLPAPVAIATWASRVDTLPGTYTRLGPPSEFHDSLLIVPDLRERLMWRINMVDGTRSPFGSQGAGPGEYQRAGWTGKVHRDSVAIFQLFPSEPFPVIDVVTGRGRTYRPSLDADNQNIEAFLMSVSGPLLRQADTLGRFYGAPNFAPPRRDSASDRMMPPSSMIDTAPIVRYALSGGGADTLFRYATGNQAAAPSRNVQGAPTLVMGLGSYGAINSWYVSPGGDLLVVDAARYTVRLWRTAKKVSSNANATTAGNADASANVNANASANAKIIEVRQFTLSWPSIPVSDRGWKAHVQQTTQGSIALIEKSLSDVSARMEKPMPRPMAPRYIVPEKPTRMSPVNFSGSLQRIQSVNNIAWIPVHRTEPPLTPFWDLVDIERGERIITLQLPANHRLLHVSPLGAYVAAKDDDDLERILLYRP